MKPGERLMVDQEVRYNPPEYLFSRNRGLRARVIATNRHGHVTIQFIEGPCINHRRGVKPCELLPVLESSGQ